MIIKQKLAGNIDFDYKWYDIYNCDDHDIRLLKDDFDYLLYYRPSRTSSL